MAIADWKSLRHANGPAGIVPSKVKVLLDPKAEPFARHESHVDLGEMLVQPATWFSASPAAVDLLLSSLAKAPEPWRVLALVADIVGADSVRGYGTDQRSGAAAERSVAAALAHAPALLDALGSKSTEMRVSLPVLLALLPALRERTWPELVAQAERDPEPKARASALLALGPLGGAPEALYAAVRANDEALVQGAGAVSRLRARRDFPLDNEAEGVIAWLRQSDRTFPWFGPHDTDEYYRGGNYGEVVGSYPRPLVVIARARGREAEIALVRRCVEASRRDDLGRVFAIQAARMVLALGDFPEFDPHKNRFAAVPASALTEQQLLVARELAASRLVPEAHMLMPASGAPRRRWLGIDPPGPLDAPDGESGGAPRWVACGRHIARTRDEGGDQLPPQVAALGPAERLLALLELAASSYGFFCPFPVEVLEAAVAASAQSLDRLRPIVDDLAERISAELQVNGRSSSSSSRVTALAVVPFARAGRPIPEGWEVLFNLMVPEDFQHLVGESFSALPPVRRARAIIAAAGRTPGAERPHPAEIERIRPFVRLAPTAELAAHLVKVWRGLEPKRRSEGDALMKLIFEGSPELGALPARGAAQKTTTAAVTSKPAAKTTATTKNAGAKKVPAAAKRSPRAKAAAKKTTKR